MKTIKRNKTLVGGSDFGYNLLEKRDKRRDISFLPWGLKALSDKGSYTPGYPIYIGAYPGSGKTELILEMQMQLSELYGKKHVVFAGEMGGPEEIYELLYWKYGGKPIRKYDRGNEAVDYQTELEASRSIDFVNAHFLVIDPLALPKGFTFDKMIKLISDELRVGSFSISDIDTISIDSFYELHMDGGTAINVQLQHLLTEINNWCEANKKTVFISTHIAITKNYLKLPNGTFYRDRPSMYDWTGGQLWSRRGSQIWNLYLPHTDYAYFSDKDGEEIKPEPWSSWIQVEKVKFKEMGKKGDIQLFWDGDKSRYYEKDHNGNRLYSRDWKKEESDDVYNAAAGLEPSNEFDTAPF